MLSQVLILGHKNLDVLLLYGKQRADLMVLALKQLSSACAFHVTSQIKQQKWQKQEQHCHSHYLFLLSSFYCAFGM